MNRAIIYVPSEDPAHVRWVLVCGHYCTLRGYQVTAIVGVWADAAALIKCGETSIVVAARRDHIPPDRIPRLEIAAEACAEMHPPAAPPLLQRTMRTSASRL